jgi:hypothetical protein
MRFCVAIASALTILGGTSVALGEPAGELGGVIGILRNVGPNGKGSQEAARAWQELAKADVRQLPQILAGMDGANALAKNWLRAAIDSVLERASTENKSIPAAALETFVLDLRHDPQARRLAYELILDGDKTAADRFLPGMVDDPSPELRRDAVARVLEQAEKLLGAQKKEEALRLFQKSLASARDQDQVGRAARRLRELGQPVDLATHLGLILNWKLIGPFANVDQKGVQAVYPPEEKIDLAVPQDGKAGPVRWTDYVSRHEYGIVDLNEGVGPHTEAVAYALTEFTSPEAQTVDIRVGCYTVFKLWVNGELVLARGDAYTGMRLDHYVAKARLRPGRNEILVKVCQDIPPDQVPKLWRFQLRVCDASGAAILSTTRPASPVPEKKP